MITNFKLIPFFNKSQNFVQNKQKPKNPYAMSCVLLLSELLKVTEFLNLYLSLLFGLVLGSLLSQVG